MGRRDLKERAMTTTFELKAEPRSDVGKGASRRLRRAGKVPAIVYGAHRDPEPIVVDEHELARQLEHEAFYSHILVLRFADGREERVVLKDIQRHPWKPRVLHLDFQRVSETEAIRMHVPLHFVGEDVAPGVKQGGLLTHELIEVEVECLPKDLPEYIEVDVSGLGLGEALHLSDLKLPEGVRLVELMRGPEHDVAVVSIHARRGAAEEGEEEGGEAAEGGEGEAA